MWVSGRFNHTGLRCKPALLMKPCGAPYTISKYNPPSRPSPTNNASCETLLLFKMQQTDAGIRRTKVCNWTPSVKPVWAVTCDCSQQVRGHPGWMSVLSDSWSLVSPPNSALFSTPAVCLELKEEALHSKERLGACVCVFVCVSTSARGDGFQGSESFLASSQQHTTCINSNFLKQSRWLDR